MISIIRWLLVRDRGWRLAMVLSYALTVFYLLALVLLWGQLVGVGPLILSWLGINTTTTCAYFIRTSAHGRKKE